MHCPFCTNSDTKVLESRLLDDAMRRRRECLKCANRFTTYERTLLNLNVVKKDGAIEPFNVQKIASSVEKACGKADPQTALSLANKIQRIVLRKKMNPIKTILIGKAVLNELKKTDKLAYLRFASIYKEIDDPKLLKKEINLLA
jgi:transcriptional repressor NrdR